MADLLSRLLDAWRLTRDPALEAAIIRIGRERAGERGPIDAPEDQLEVTWKAIAAAGDPNDIDRLLDAPWPKTWLVARPRVEALAGMIRDPRVALGLVRVATRYSTPTSQPFHTTIAQLLEQTPFPSLAVALRTLVHPRGPKAVYARAAMLAARVEVTAADPALIAEAAVPPPPQMLVDLTAALATDPGDLAVRGVLADVLIATGDPRGELIVLQTAIAEGRGSHANERRIAALLEIHGRTLLGGLPTEVAACRFDRGFVVAAKVSTNHRDYARSFEQPGWATVEELEIIGPARDVEPLLHRLARLRVLVVRSSYEAFATTDGPFPSVRALGFDRLHLPATLQMFPNVAVLAVPWPVGPLGMRDLHQYAARLGIRALVHVRLPLTELRGVLLGRAHGPPEIRISFGSRGVFYARKWTVWIARDRNAIRIAWAGSDIATGERELATILDACATTGITHIAASFTPADRAVIEPAITRKIADISHRVALGKQLVPLDVTYDDDPIDLTSP